MPVASTGFFGGFNDVSSVSATDGWAVGGNGNGVVHRFNGTRWSVVPSPNLLTGGNTWGALSGVDVVSPATVFAVGSASGSAGEAAVALRWNGSAWNGTAWSRLTSPNNGSTFLYEVAAISRSDARAVGNGSAGAFVTRWNGTTWNAAPAPPLSTLHGRDDPIRQRRLGGR